MNTNALLKRAKVAKAVVRSRVARLRGKATYRCNVCGFRGDFEPDVGDDGYRRPHARCPRCTSRERHRLQLLVLDRIFPAGVAGSLTCLHFAPDPLYPHLHRRFGRTLTADFNPARTKPVPPDLAADMRRIGLADGSVDVVFASHVLEHIDDDRAAIAEIHRILRPGGVAVLPLPIVAERTVDYGAPNPNEFNHLRAPGVDYFDRYRQVFGQVDVFSSDDVDPEFQTYLYEDRSIYPNERFPLRPGMVGERFCDYVPVCRKSP